MIKKMTPDQVREAFQIENDFTPEEEAAVKQEIKCGAPRAVDYCASTATLTSPTPNPTRAPRSNRWCEE